MAWSGKTYRFCSRSCLEQFEAAPEKFAAPEGGKA
jgi:YHS domain-containing protein